MQQPGPEGAQAQQEGRQPVQNVTRIALVRHGETFWNADGRMQGHLDIELNERGKEQASVL